MNTPTIAPPTKPDATTMPSLQLWSKIAQTPELVGYFDGVFGKAGISVEESGEEFTVTNQGNGFALSPGIDKDVDFIVPVKQENITRLAEHAVKGAFDPHESWRIVRVLFTPLTRAALQSPTVRKNWIRLLSGVEAVIHV